MKVKRFTFEGSASEIDVDDAIFGLPARGDLLHRVVNWQLAKRRAGTRNVPARAEVSGTGKKMYRQKKTGRARHSTSKAPQFRGGGRTFGLPMRDYGFDLPLKIRSLALKTALSVKAAKGRLAILDEAKMTEPKTKVAAERLEKLGWLDALIIDGADMDGSFRLAVRNLPKVGLLPTMGANVYEILRHDWCVLTDAGLKAMETRLK